MNINRNNAEEWLLPHYEKEILNKLSDKQILNLYNKSQPKKVKISELENKNINEYKINSPDGYVFAHKWRNKGKKPCVYLETVNKKKINASYDHFFLMSTGKWKYAKYITPGEYIDTINGSERVVSVSEVGEHTVYDFHINHENHRYYTNDITSHNSGSGKSLFMANLGVNWALAGMNVLYLTFELSENLVSMRIDSMVTGVPSRDIFKSIDDVELRVKMIGKKSGAFQVKYMPTGKNANDLRSYIREYEIKTGKRIDVVLVDYLDLMSPIGSKISSENLFVKDKYVSEELRNLAMELNVILVTASQLNRGSVEEVEFDHSHISGGISKINTADNLIGIFTSRAMRERGKYQLQLMKTRSSSGVNSKIELEFDVNTLRITDSNAEEEEPSSPQLTQIKDKIKRKNTETTTDFTDTTPHTPEEPKVRAETDSTKLREFLNNLK